MAISSGAFLNSVIASPQEQYRQWVQSSRIRGSCSGLLKHIVLCVQVLS